MDESKPNSAHKKVLAIMSKIAALPKRGHNSFSNYNYVTEFDAAEAIRKGCVEEGLVILPSVTASEIHYPESGGKGAWANVTMEYLFCDPETGDNFKTAMVGSAKDTGDKAIYKAITGAQKYCYMKCFHVGGSDDAEADSPEAYSSAPATFTLEASPAPNEVPVLTRLIRGTEQEMPDIAAAPRCEKCDKPMKLKAAGVSKNGKEYTAFWGCKTKAGGKYCNGPTVSASVWESTQRFIMLCHDYIDDPRIHVDDDERVRILLTMEGHKSVAAVPAGAQGAFIAKLEELKAK